MDLREKTLSQSYAYKGRIINLRTDEVELPNGKSAGREIVEHPGGVCIAALTDQNEVLFVRQYRHPYGEIILEIPAGKLEKGEDPLECGKRELEEETGWIATSYRSLGLLYPSPGYCAEIIYMFLAENLSPSHMNPDEDEFLEPLKIPLEKAVQMIISGEIKDAKTQAAVLKINAMKSATML